MQKLLLCLKKLWKLGVGPTWATDPVDVVTFSYSLSMMPDWLAALDNAKRILRPGGQIESRCDGLCDATDPGEKPFNITPECDPFVP